MTESLHALLTGVIDYAGLFPPASLSMEESIRNYAQYVQSDERSMLGRFICPAARLSELSPLIPDSFDENQPLAISALGRGGKDVAEFLANVQADLLAIHEFKAQHHRSVTIDVFETRVPADDAALEFDPTGMSVCIESAPALIDAIAHKGERFGFKLRTGGVEAEAFPTAETVASVIAHCRDTDVPLKFTAGMHHPVRRFNASVNARMHGFINVFAAGVLAFTQHLDTPAIAEILLNEDADAFRFDDGAMTYKDFRATVPQIAAARRSGVVSFGSCSFDEPREDLRSLGWL